MTNLPAPLPVPDQTVTTRWRSTTGLRTVLVWLFAADVAAAIALAAAELHQAGLIDDYERGQSSLSALRDADGVIRGMATVTALGVLATATVLIIWQWRSAKNNEVLGRIQPRFSAGWSIGGWFVPFANAVIPVRIFQDLWQGSDPETRNLRDWRGLRRWPVIGWWWAFWIAGYGLERIAAGSTTTTLAEVRTNDRVTAVAVLLTAVAACLAIVVVRTITRRQEAARAERRPSSSPGPRWYPDPTGRFDHRYWDGTRWTESVSKGGQVANDPIVEIG